MKKIFASVVLSLLLAGCFGSGVSQEQAAPVAVTENSSSEVATAPIFEEKSFIEISAAILCLPTNNPDDAPEEIEAKAKAVLAKNNVSEQDFNAFQEKVIQDSKEKMRLSYEIIGKMTDYCEIAKPGEAAAPVDSSQAPVSGETKASEVVVPRAADIPAATNSDAPASVDSKVSDEKAVVNSPAE